MTRTIKIDLIINQIENLSSDELMKLNNLYIEKRNYSDNEIFLNDEDFFQTFFQDNIVEAVRAVSFGDFTFMHRYVKFNGYGNLESLYDITVNNLVETPETMAEYALENDDDFDGLLELDL